MNKNDAIYIARKYYEHDKAWHEAKDKNDIKYADFHEGCKSMCLQIFENTNHEFGSPSHALRNI